MINNKGTFQFSPRPTTMGIIKVSIDFHTNHNWVNPLSSWLVVVRIERFPKYLWGKGTKDIRLYYVCSGASCVNPNGEPNWAPSQWPTTGLLWPSWASRPVPCQRSHPNPHPAYDRESPPILPTKSLIAHCPLIHLPLSPSSSEIGQTIHFFYSLWPDE